MVHNGGVLTALDADRGTESRLSLLRSGTSNSLLFVFFSNIHRSIFRKSSAKDDGWNLEETITSMVKNLFANVR